MCQEVPSARLPLTFTNERQLGHVVFHYNLRPAPLLTNPYSVTRHSGRISPILVPYGLHIFSKTSLVTLCRVLSLVTRTCLILLVTRTSLFNTLDP
jgi:hypothetical protein